MVLTSTAVADLVPRSPSLDRGETLGFEAHSLTHPNLLAVDDVQAEQEIAGSKAELEDRLGRRVTAFSYPSGLFGERERRLVDRAGYALAVSCEPGINLPTTDRFALRRRQIDARDSLLDFRAKVAGGHDTPLPLRGLYRRVALWRRQQESTTGERAAVEVSMRLEKRVEPEVLLDTCPTRGAEARTKIGIVDEALERIGEGACVTGGDEQAGLAV